MISGTTGVGLDHVGHLAFQAGNVFAIDLPAKSMSAVVTGQLVIEFIFKMALRLLIEGHPRVCRSVQATLAPWIWRLVWNDLFSRNVSINILPPVQ